jgi:hypothetical protein
MPRRPGHDLTARTTACPAVLGAVVTVAFGAAACQTGDPGTAGCLISQQVVVPSSPLTLLRGARLDRVASGLAGNQSSGFALLGVDGDGATARWAAYDATAGALGPERALALTPGAAGPWLTLASEKAQGDTLIVVEAVVAAGGADAELHVVAVPSSASLTTAPALGPPLVVIPGAFANGATPTVALGASRSGPHAVLAWIDPTASAVTALVLSAAGEQIGQPTVVEKAPAFACLAFAPGKDALTLVYHRYAAGTRIPAFVITELLDSGAVDASLELLLDSHAADCPRLTPTAAGYAIAFQDTEGSWLGVYEKSTNSFNVNPFAAAVAFGGAALQPPLAGLAPMGADFAAVLDRTHGGELWRLTAGGAHRAGRLAMPSLEGSISDISTQPDAGSLTATYADYSSVDGGVGTAGQRYFLNMACQ